MTTNIDRDRAFAMDRALYMSKLFREEYYPAIVSAINLYKSQDPKAREKAERDFIAICHNAHLNEKEIGWLWNYLKNYDEEKGNWRMRAQMPPW